MKCSLKIENKKKFCITLIISFCVFDLIFSACSTFSKYSKDTFIVLYEHICVICIRTAPSLSTGCHLIHHVGRFSQEVTKF